MHPGLGEALKRLEYLKGVSSFETQTVDVPVDLVSESLIVTAFVMDVVPTVDAVEPWLRKQLLVRDGKPTVAALLLFSDEPQVALPKQSAVKIYRYATTDAEGTRATLIGQPITIEGAAYDVIKESVRTAVDTVQGIRILGASGLEEISYPQVTLHEIITNAVLHRDYSIADDIHVRIFDNRVEVRALEVCQPISRRRTFWTNGIRATGTSSDGSISSPTRRIKMWVRASTPPSPR